MRDLRLGISEGRKVGQVNNEIVQLGLGKSFDPRPQFRRDGTKATA
jgi:hypothetical protein